jgi:hypothetical protein
VSTPGAARHLPPLIALLGAFGLARGRAPGAAGEPAEVLATFGTSHTIRRVRRWAVVAVVALATPVAVLNAYDVEILEFYHVAVPIATAVIVPAWILELSGVRWPFMALIAATILPNVWLTVIGDLGTNIL